MSTDSANKNEPRIEIRASGLPYSTDCWRRWAMQMAIDPKSGFMPVLQKHGFNFQMAERKNIGATIGTACHEGIGAFLQAKIDGYAGSAHSSPAGNPLYVAKNKFTRLIQEGEMPTDRETPNATTAEQQIDRMLSVYIPHVETLQPKRVEFKLETRLDPLKPYMVTGHPDIYTTDYSIRDMKFGKNLSAYEAQLGAYRLMARSHGMETSRLFVDWVKRVTLKSTQPPLQIIEYNQHTAENAAHHLIEEGVRQIEKFTETGNPWAFPANPNSMLCSKKWCPAWGTEFCDMGRPEKDKVD